MVHIVLLAVVGLAGGGLGSMVGLGAGVFIIPALSLFLGVPVHTAIAASLVAIVATSTTAAASYCRDNLTNLRLGMTLETFTVSGALAGGLLGAALGREVLSGIFGGVMVLVSVYMGLRQGHDASLAVSEEERGLLGGSCPDRSLGRVINYRVRRLPAGLVASLVAGGVSGLLGVGGGFLKVPVMVLAMGVPVRAAVATSSFMIGVTATAGSLVYFTRGMVDPVTTVPVVLGVTLGAHLGSRLAQRVRSAVLARVLAAFLFLLAVQMILAAVGIRVR